MSGARREPDAGGYQLQPAGGQDPGFFGSGPNLQGGAVQMPMMLAVARRVGKGAQSPAFMPEQNRRRQVYAVYASWSALRRAHRQRYIRRFCPPYQLRIEVITT